MNLRKAIILGIALMAVVLSGVAFAEKPFYSPTIDKAWIQGGQNSHRIGDIVTEGKECAHLGHGILAGQKCLRTDSTKALKWLQFRYNATLPVRIAVG